MGCLVCITEAASRASRPSTKKVGVDPLPLERRSDEVVAVTKPQRELFFDRYDLGEKIGRGGYAQVRSLSEQSLVAKVMDLRSQDEDGDFLENKAYRREAEAEECIWRILGSHTNVVSLHAAFYEEGVSFFVMDRCDWKLSRFLHDKAEAGDLNERSLAVVAGEILQGLLHLHKLGVVHRDVKPDNIMVAGDVCKLIDFGLAAVLPDDGSGLRGVYGTAPYMCPEMLKMKHYGTEVDLWSFGVIMYVLFYGTFPYMPRQKTSTQMKAVIKEGKKLPAFAPVRSTPALQPMSLVAEEFVRLLLNREQLDRITAAEALQLNFITSTARGQSGASLNLNFRVALRSGAFDNRSIDRPDSLDDYLDMLYEDHTGRCLPRTLRSESDYDAELVKRDSSTVSDGSTTASSCGAASSFSAPFVPHSVSRPSRAAVAV